MESQPPAIPKKGVNSESKEIGRASGILALSTLLSRVLGLLRNQILSHFFGAGLAADAFIAAFTIPNALRRLFGEGGLTPAFVSIFTRSLYDPKSNWRNFVSSSFLWLTLCLVVLSLLGMIFAPLLVWVYVPEFSQTPGKFEMTVQLTRFLFPFVLLICWAAFFMGILNSFKKFALPALGPAIMNFTIVCLAPLALWSGWIPEAQGIFVFSLCILIGVSIQLIVQLPTLRRLGALPKLSGPWLDPRVIELGQLLLPAVFSMGIYQLNIIVNRVFASRIPGAVSHLYYSDLIIELPVSLIATSMSVAAMPSFTRLLVEKKHHELGQTFKFSSCLNAGLAIPSMIGILVLSFPIISSIFFTGEFSLGDSQVSAEALCYYALGIPFYCLLRSLLPLFFADKDTKTPAIIGFVALGVNFFGAWQLSRIMGSPGIALSTALSSFTQFSLLCVIAIYRYKFFPWLEVLKLIGKIGLAGSFMGLLLYGGSNLIPEYIWINKGISILKLLSLGGLIGLGVLTYGAGIHYLKIPAIEPLLRKIKTQITPENSSTKPKS